MLKRESLTRACFIDLKDNFINIRRGVPNG